jgi:3-phenylpropionate/trans-cinnamate dioxygenase ferredoxin reductase subunit
VSNQADSLTIVGGSLAGLRGAESLRRGGFEGRISFVGDERHLPYDRPPLSKQFLASEWDAERISLSDPEKFAALNLDLHLGRGAVSLDVPERAVVLDDGTTVKSDAVLITTGARARKLHVPDRNGLHVLRTLDDARALEADLSANPNRVVVVGAGFIGAEVAATARGKGLAVTMIDPAEAPMIRGLGVEIGTICGEVHQEHGVDLRLNVGVTEILGEDRVTGVVLDDGSAIDCEVVLVGIGVIPNTEWLEDSDLTIDNGIVCDETCLAAPGIAAAGDVARWPNPLFGELMRVEHWDNAIDQGTYAAKRLVTGEADEPFAPVPWFWSDQYDRKIQLAGRTQPGDEMAIIDGNVEERKFAAIFGRDKKLTGVFGMNRPRHVMQFRRLLADGASFEEALEFASGA